MLTVTVAQDGSGDFASIAEAVLAVPYKEEALVQVGPHLPGKAGLRKADRKSTRLNSSHMPKSRMPSSA